jgi:hypothetical protein
MRVLQSRLFLTASAGADAPAMTASITSIIPVASGLLAERELEPVSHRECINWDGKGNFSRRDAAANGA